MHNFKCCQIDILIIYVMVQSLITIKTVAITIRGKNDDHKRVFSSCYVPNPLLESVSKLY